MENGFKIEWTDHALSELSETYEYLESNFTEGELNKLSIEIQKTIKLISINPSLFPYSKSKSVRRAVILKYNTLYYRLRGNTIEVISFFNNRKNPSSRSI
jgi:plasmid stabilization system protein ParE